MFACNINHANQLATLLSRSGVPSQAVHSANNAEDNQTAISEFREGRINTLVAVEMLTSGFDVPEIDAIFLTRPTASLTLLAQMVGRGARKSLGKDSFTIVEFTDSVTRLGSQLFHAKEYTQGVAPTSATMPSGCRVQHDEPEDVPRFEVLQLPGLAGVPFACDQTFGVEIEIGASPRPRSRNRDWRVGAQKIIECLKHSASLPVCQRPLGYHENSEHCSWRVCYDSSCGWEVVSPILVNRDGFDELARVSQDLDRFLDQSPTMRINHQTGLHITLATRLNTKKRRRGFAARLTRLENGLYTLVAPSRLYHWDGPYTYNNRRRNEYCEPYRDHGYLEELPSLLSSGSLSRYHSVNLDRIDNEIQLLEVRMHQGTTDYRKIIPWIALWMQIFNHSRYQWQGEYEFGRVLPGGNTAIGLWRVGTEDIFQLLEREKIFLPQPLRQLLRKRRRKLRGSWKHAVPNRVARWEAGGWYDCIDPA
ncbi:helicase-related protein [Neorhodopirellula lusitana]|uniref:helicase-related protein n=1 Tax=Neorhodopirellula lusitana TaxID=445327 RepID=UPI00385016FE